MSESLTRPSWLRSRSHIPGSFNTEDELSPIKSSFDLDDTHQTLDAGTTGPGAPLYSDDSSLQLPEHDDIGGEYFQNQTMGNADNREMGRVDGDSSLSMIASSTISRLGSSSVQSIMGVSSHAHENDSPPSPEYGRDDDGATKTSITPSEDPAPLDFLASSSPTLSSKLSTQPSTLQAQPFQSSPITEIQLHRSASTQTITATSHSATTQNHQPPPDYVSFPLVEIIRLIKMHKLLSREKLDAWLEQLVEKYLTVTPEDTLDAPIIGSSNQGKGSILTTRNSSVANPTLVDVAQDEPSAAYYLSETDKWPSLSHDETNVRPPVSENERPMSPLGLRAQSDNFDRLTKDNFDLRVKVSFLQRKVDEMDDEQLEKLGEENANLKADIVKSTKLAQSMQQRIQDLETMAKSSEKRASRIHLESKTTITKINDLEEELVERQTEITELHRKVNDASSRTNIEKQTFIKRIAEKEASIKHVTETNEALFREVRAQTLMLTSRNNERDFLIAQLEELKLSIESRRSSSDESRASKSDRERYEDRIGNLKDQLSASKLAELGTAKKYQTKRKECDELHSMVEHLDGLLDKKGENVNALNKQIKALEQEGEQLRNEVRILENNMVHLEADCQTRIRRVQELESESQDMCHELQNIEKALVDANGNNKKLTIELESRNGECTFLRGEQDSTMMRVGALESEIKALQTNLHDTIAESKVNLNEATRESDKLRVNETQLQENLDAATRESDKLRTQNNKLHQDLQAKVLESDILRKASTENETLLKARTALMENNVLETRRLTEQLEKERQLHRQDKTQHEQWARTHQHTSRIINQKDARITELEAARSSDRKKLNTLEQSSKEQVAERNQLLLSLWHRLSTVCGTDWQHQNNLVNGHLPTFDVVNNMLPAFTKNLMLAVKCIERSVGTFEPRIGHVEQAFAREFESLERNLDMKSRRLERLEGQVLAYDARAGLQRNTSYRSPPGMPARHHSTTDIETIERAKEQQAHSHPIESSEKRWVHRLRELERRLKAEREGRLLDRSAARERMSEQNRAMELLRGEMERMEGRL